MAKLDIDINATIESISAPNVIKASISVGNLVDKLMPLANSTITSMLETVLPHEAYTMEGGRHITLYVDKIPQLQTFCEMFVIKALHINEGGLAVLCDVK